MAGTLKDAVDADSSPRTRLLTVVLHYDDALTPTARQVVWPGTKVIFGRGTEDSLNGGRFTLNDPRVSTDHAELFSEGEGAVLRDLGSSNGSWVNGQRVSGRALLASGDLIELGRTVLVYREAPAAQANHVLANTGATFGALRTLNPELGDVYRQLSKLAATQQAGLIVGETGTGKDVLARELHRASGRSGQLVAIDCGAVPDTLFESTLFGHERGAFTGATEARVGEIARAHEGTLLLDEVGNLTAAAQAKLLRVMETSVVARLGGTKTQQLDIRWLAATNRLVLEEGDGFRADLLHRLAGFVVSLPPLRRRREDLGLLINHLLNELKVMKATITPAAGRILMNHALGGNVRQLRNVLQRSAHAGGEVVIGEESLGALERPESQEPTEEDNGNRAAVPDQARLEAALANANGNVAEAARTLGTYPKQLYRWMARAGVTPGRFRSGGNS
jgi:DNA-binding NtrC family response regulator